MDEYVFVYKSSYQPFPIKDVREGREGNVEHSSMHTRDLLKHCKILDCSYLNKHFM